jgi:hypothetical protein
VEFVEVVVFAAGTVVLTAGVTGGVTGATGTTGATGATAGHTVWQTSPQSTPSSLASCLLLKQLSEGGCNLDGTARSKDRLGLLKEVLVLMSLQLSKSPVSGDTVNDTPAQSTIAPQDSMQVSREVAEVATWREPMSSALASAQKVYIPEEWSRTVESCSSRRRAVVSFKGPEGRVLKASILQQRE